MSRPPYDPHPEADGPIDDEARGAMSGGWRHDTIAPPEVWRHAVAISLRLAAVPTDDDILELSRRNPGFEFERTAAGELVVSPGGYQVRTARTAPVHAARPLGRIRRQRFGVRTFDRVSPARRVAAVARCIMGTP